MTALKEGERPGKFHQKDWFSGSTWVNLGYTKEIMKSRRNYRDTEVAVLEDYFFHRKNFYILWTSAFISFAFLFSFLKVTRKSTNRYFANQRGKIKHDH